MTDSEKWAVWTLGVVVVTVIAYFVLVALRGNGPITLSAFAFTALVALPKLSRRGLTGSPLDERESGIAHKALLASFRAMWVLVVMLFVITGWIKGWDTTLSLPMWKLAEAIWWLGTLMLAVRAVITLVLYRRGSHA